MELTPDTTSKAEGIEQPNISNLFPNDDSCDVAFIVEGKHFFLSKAVMSVISPVFRRMFESDFKEKECKEVPLPEKTAEEMEEFLGAIYPSVMTSLESCDIFRLLRLADEYQVDSLKKRCGEHLTRMCNNMKSKEIPLKDFFEMLLAADRYDLRDLADVLIPLSRKLFYSDIEKVSFFDDLSDRMKVEVLKMRVKALEPVYEGGQLAHYIRELVPCSKRHTVLCGLQQTSMSCPETHDTSNASAALDFLLCRYLQCTSLDMPTTVEWLKFVRTVKCPNALKILKESNNSPEFSEILRVFKM